MLVIGKKKIMEYTQQQFSNNATLDQYEDTTQPSDIKITI